MGSPTDPFTHLRDRLPGEIEKQMDSGGWSPLYAILAGAGLAIARSIDGLKDAVLDHTDPAEPKPDPSRPSPMKGDAVKILIGMVSAPDAASVAPSLSGISGDSSLVNDADLVFAVAPDGTAGVVKDRHMILGYHAEVTFVPRPDGEVPS